VRIPTGVRPGRGAEISDLVGRRLVDLLERPQVVDERLGLLGLEDGKPVGVFDRSRELVASSRSSSIARSASMSASSSFVSDRQELLVDDLFEDRHS